MEQVGADAAGAGIGKQHATGLQQLEGIDLQCERDGRLLDAVDRLGLREDDLNKFRLWIHKPNGIVLVTGPTGSGKTTTLYSALNEINNPTDKIISISQTSASAAPSIAVQVASG